MPGLGGHRDEHFFTRRPGYATTICDLRNRKIYDVRLGRSGAPSSRPASASRHYVADRSGTGWSPVIGVEPGIELG
jgi:hypothetical protein